MSKENKKQKHHSRSRQDNDAVMWGEYRVDNFHGPSDLSGWDLGEDTPYLAPSKVGLQIVTPICIFKDDEMDFMDAGISFLDIVKSYKEVFLSPDMFCLEEIECYRKEAIEELRQAIAILEDKQS